MIWQAIKFLFLATWSSVIGFMVASVAEAAQPTTHFGAVTLLASVLFFALLWSTFGDAAIAPSPHRFRPEEEPLVGCPTCHSPMHLLGANVRGGRTTLYLWTCERDHGWSRQGDSPADETYPWQACNAAEMVGVFFG